MCYSSFAYVVPLILSIIFYFLIHYNVKMSNPFENVVGGFVTLNTNHPMPLIGLGTYKIIKENVLPALDAALSAGYRSFDTAKYYFNEKEIGEALQELLPKYKLTRGDIFLTTKIFPRKDDSAGFVREAVKESLENLKTDYIDLYLIHYPTYGIDDEANKDEKNPQIRRETYLELEKMKDEGLIRSVGISNFDVKHIQEIKDYGKIMPAVNQCEYHPHFTRNEIREECKKNGISFTAFSSLGRMEPSLIGDSTLAEIAEKHNTTVELVLLSFALSQKIAVVPKSTNPTRIENNLKCANFQLTADEVAKLQSLDKGIQGNYIRCYGWRVL